MKRLPDKNPPAGAAERIGLMQPFHVMNIMEKACGMEASGRRIIHMEIGQPDFGAPPQVIEAAARAMKEHTLGYTSTLGIPELRRVIAEYYLQRYGVSVPASRIAITAGASGALLLAMGVLLNPGDEVLLPDPSYSCNANFLRLFGATPILMPVDEATLYQPTLEGVQAAWTDRTRGVLIASPANPTGTSMADKELNAICKWVHGRNGFVIVDEIYQELCYESRGYTAIDFAPGTWIINSFSKYFGMTGWRLGWMVLPEEMDHPVEKLAQNVFICPSALAQRAALAAFQPETLAVLEARKAELRQRRDFLVPALRDLGFHIPIMPDGAFYIYAGCQGMCDDTAQFAFQVLEDAGVALTPGVDFGVYRAAMHVRFAYTRSMDDLEEGVDRLRGFLAR